MLVVLISAAGIALEKERLNLDRRVSRQQYRLDVLRDRQARLRLRTEQLGAPNRTIDALEKGTLEIRRADRQRQSQSEHLPLLLWRGLSSPR